MPLAKETLPDFEVVNWYGMVVRAGTPRRRSSRACIRRWRTRCASLTSPSAPPGWASTSSAARLMSSRAFQREEIAKWGAVIRTANIKLD